jgi:hypothetical protein|tara:strand:+ start:3251 stop:3514 length:264 start_codon:yes stop_codon:yes gene_type:complete
MQKAILFNTSYKNLTKNLLSKKITAIKDADETSCKTVYKNIKFNSVTNFADGNENDFVAQMYNKYYSGRSCMLTFKNDAIVSMYTLN